MRWKTIEVLHAIKNSLPVFRDHMEGPCVCVRARHGSVCGGGYKISHKVNPRENESSVNS